MASDQSYKITLSNNNTEKQGIKYVTENDSTLFEVDKETKKQILDSLNIDSKYIRAFDLIKVDDKNIIDGEITVNDSHELILVELKQLRKNLLIFQKDFSSVQQKMNLH